MICRHSPGDPNCSSYSKTKIEYVYKEIPSNEPDKKDYFIEQVESVGPHLIIKVRYPSCKKCAYEGNKILVYLNVDIKQTLFWKEIDPHFKDPKVKVTKHQAPTPNARFPANEEG